MDKKRLVDSMRRLAERLEGEIPEIKLVFDKVRDENLAPDDALEKISQLLMVRPDLHEKMQVSLTDGPKELPEPSDDDVEKALTNVSEDAQRALATMGMTIQALFYRDADDGKIKLNPLYQVSLLERLQFDGDVPELRLGGDLPRGDKAAVPVEHDSPSPVALGAKLAQASEEVTKEIEDLRESRTAAADLALTEAAAASVEGDNETHALAVTTAKNALMELEKPLDVPGYERGKLPQKRKIEGPTGSELALMPEEKKREFAYKAYSTTQGRRSSVPAIGKLVEQAFERAGFSSVVVVDQWTGRPQLAKADWTMTLNGGPRDTSSNFSPIMAASASISAKLLKALRSSKVNADANIEVEVAPVNDYGERVIGWKAQAVVARDQGQLEGHL